MDSISIRGARTHNLRNVSVDLPRGRYVVFTGVSGSGKSSLAFDTLYAEGERRYVESLSPGARQLLERLPRADVDAIEGLPPAIAIGQDALAGGSVGARATVGTVSEVADHLRLLWARLGVPHCPEHGLALSQQSVASMTDRLLLEAKGRRVMLLAPVRRGRAFAPGEAAATVARFLSEGYRRFRADGAVEAFDEEPEKAWLADGAPHDLEVVADRLRVTDDARERIAGSLETVVGISDGRVVAADMDSDWRAEWSTKYACPRCDWTAGPLEPRSFSASSPRGACAVCSGSGRVEGDQTCPECGGTGLGELARCVRIAGRSYAEACGLPAGELLEFVRGLAFEGAGRAIAERVTPGLVSRLGCLCDLGLDYLAPARRADTLSGGEAQRIRLAAQIGSGLSGVLYVLDEPCSGLHPRDGERLIGELRRLRDRGNTLVVVEHDEAVIRSADRIVDLGPGAGEAGGRIVAQGSPEQIAADPDSVTGAYLSGRSRIEAPHPRFSAARSKWLRLTGACGRTLRDVTLAIPLGALTTVTGVSGSGKSTLVSDTLLPALSAILAGEEPAGRALPFGSVEGTELVDKVIAVDQSPIGRSPRANAATYTGVFTLMRELFAQTLTARERGYGPARFSFNARGGRCEACGGEGALRVSMQFLPDVFVTCDVCGGRRYNRETLECRWKGLSIADALDLSVDEARTFFAANAGIRRRLDALAETGLGYLRLGQSSATLSGGEAQRLKLAAELAREGTGRTLYILDEPTRGLHFADVEKLLRALRRLTALGNTVLVVEHDLSIAAASDWIVDMGPGGGGAGGRIVAEGTPAQVARNRASVTGPWLARRREEASR